MVVSTHSRPKAAGCASTTMAAAILLFQHTAARRRLATPELENLAALCVSTHSRPKAAGHAEFAQHIRIAVSTHSRPKAAGQTKSKIGLFIMVSTHSRPKAAGCGLCSVTANYCCFNTQPPEGGWVHEFGKFYGKLLFQHTAARRRLVLQ